MAANACCYNVLIASSGDASEERKRAFDTIAEWNGRTQREAIFIPLMWERHAISDADSQGPQDAINKQLLARSDFVIAIFRGRIGTPTGRYPGGTVEELAERSGRAAVFFCNEQPTIPKGAKSGDIERIAVELRQLEAFKSRFAGLSRDYADAEDLEKKIRDQLDGWADALGKDRPPALMAAIPGTWTFESLVEMGAGDAPERCVLLYNTELSGLKSVEAFEQTWGFLAQSTGVKRVVFLLPEFKIARLREYLPEIRDGLERQHPGLLERFSFCPVLETSSGSPPRASSSLAFALVRMGIDPGEGEYLPIAHVLPFCEPFASAQYESHSADIRWGCNYFIETRDENLCAKLQGIWGDYFNAAQTRSIIEATDKPLSVAEAKRVVQEQRESNAVPATKGRSALTLINQLKERLFDPNVPSYLLNEQFELLDWNAAFELIFPTERFYRNEHVQEFVEVLDNVDKVTTRGAEIITQQVGEDDRLLLEQLAFTSPVYGKMDFTKIASQVVLKDASGWIVALNVNHVEHRGQYEADLRRVNKEQALISIYAEGFDRFQTGFPGLTAMLERYSNALQDSANVLDLGAGPGIVTEMLLRGGKRVTAVEHNDAMLAALRARCEGLPGLSILKANVATLHAPPVFGRKKIGLKLPYDGVCLHAAYYWLPDPSAFLKRLVSQKLIAPGASLALLLATPRSDIEEYFTALQELRSDDEVRDKDFEQYLKCVEGLLDLNIFGKYAEKDVEQHFTGAGYEIVDQTRACYEIGGRRYQGLPFFVAKAPQ